MHISVCPLPFVWRGKINLNRAEKSTLIVLKNQPWDDKMNNIYKKEEDTGNESKRGI